MIRISIFATLMTIAVLAKAAVFKCETPSGIVYSEQPCPKSAKVLDLHAIKPSETIAPADNSLMQKMESDNRARKKNIEEMNDIAAKNLAAVKQAKCTEARRKLDLYQQQIRVYKRDENGEKVYVDDNARASIIDGANNEAAANCE